MTEQEPISDKWRRSNKIRSFDSEKLQLKHMIFEHKAANLQCLGQICSRPEKNKKTVQSINIVQHFETLMVDQRRHQDKQRGGKRH